MAAPPEQIAFLKAQSALMTEQSTFLKAQVKSNDVQHKAMESMHLALARTTDHVQALSRPSKRRIPTPPLLPSRTSTTCSSRSRARPVTPSRVR